MLRGPGPGEALGSPRALASPEKRVLGAWCLGLGLCAWASEKRTVWRLVEGLGYFFWGSLTGYSWRRGSPQLPAGLELPLELFRLPASVHWPCFGPSLLSLGFGV